MQNLVEPHLVFRDAGLAFAHLEGAEVVLGVAAVIIRAGAEPVQVAVGPAERSLDDVVNLVEIKVGSELELAPERRVRLLKFDPDPVGDHLRAAGAPPRTRLVRTFAVWHGVQAIAELLLGHLRAGPDLFFRRRMNG